MSNEHENDERGKKRKKKRSHIQMAKKLARRRYHGSDVDSDTYQYMVRILELMKTDFPTAEEKLLFVNNVYVETTGREIEYARNQVGSRILDSLLTYANLETIQRLVDAFGPSLRPLSSDRFASHVLQKIVVVCADRANRGPPPESKAEQSVDANVEVKESEVSSYNGIVLKLSKYFINNIEEFVFDTYANHLLRTVIECLGGLIDKPNRNDKTKLAFGKRRPVAGDFKDLLFATCNRLYKWPRFVEFGQDELTSGLLQSALYSLKDVFPEMVEAYVKKITNECFKPGKEQQLSSIFDAESSIRLLEVCLAVADEKSLCKIYEGYFSHRFKQLSVTRSTNFSVQRLLDHCSVKEDFERIFDQVSTYFPEILESGYTGVLASVANASLKLQIKQGAFVTELLKALGCEVKEKEQQHQVVACIACLKTVQQLESERKENDSKSLISLHGSLIVQAILNFNKPIKVVNSLLETDAEELVRMFEDPKGSRIVDAFMDSKYVGEKSREKLGKKLKGYWARLARSTHGSRSLDKMWQWARINQKILIVEELAAVGESLRSTKSGQIITNKLNVSLFARNKKDWTEAIGKEEKTRALFATIIGGDSKKKET
ncbi:Pumilio domain-containing protein C14orf21 [Habropoda laboriosa]|uniref:Pumilio domain-containing protein C14orf21 n=1 Tax=Habropoda laboriosa TaxID=597456 RepID=A0A0L7RE32_9HYME|nr:PREDICTED: nucleolar protein 9 [Habropoda laboriosa]KOC68986.1 Pumilio domain-containing protein C14orf21 [Habropoda laboriosa]